ncbi:MAG: recombinase RecT [Deltaproteobacteria bacterium]|nr:recombinase RecT [Deltaproteobacteria bacterium]
MSQPSTDRSGQIVPRNKANGSGGLPDLLQRMAPEIARAVPKHINPDRMVRIALTSLRMSPALMKCTPASFLGCVMSAAQLGLEIGGPFAHAYLIPYKTECTLVVSYRGMIELARRSGLVSAIYAYDVREGDRFSYTLGLNPNVEHVPSADPNREDKKISHVYAVAKLKDAEPMFVVLTWAQVLKYRNRSRAKDSGPWVTDTTAMALKTAVRRLFTWIPQSSEMARAVEIDQAPEIGRPQLSAFDESVTKALAAEGVDTSVQDAEYDSQPGADPPVEGSDREPGVD